MAVVFQTVGLKTNDPDSSNWDVDCGSTIQVGDLLIVGSGWRANSTSFIPGTTGWNALQDQVTVESGVLGVYWKIADGQEAGGSTLAVSSGNGTRGTLSLARFTGTTATPISGAQYATSSGSATTLATITFAEATGLMYCIGIGSANNTFDFTTNNGNVTVDERFDSNPTSNMTTAMATFSWNGTSSGATDITATRSNGTGGMQQYGFYIAPQTVVGPANVKTFDGVTQSTGVKTYMGVATASVKSLDGIV